MNFRLELELFLGIVILVAFYAAITWYDRSRSYIIVNKTRSGWSVWLVERRCLRDSTKHHLETYRTQDAALQAAALFAKDYGVHNGVDTDKD